MLRNRILSAAIAIPFIIIAIRFGSPWFYLMVGAVALLGLREFYRLAGKGGWQPSIICGALCTVLLLISSAHLGGIHLSSVLAFMVGLSAIWIILRSLISHTNAKMAFFNWAWTLGGVLYLGLLLGFWILLRRCFGWEWALLAILTTFAVDTSAYFIGRAWGKHSLAPRISPRKTWEGAIGGLVGGLAATIILAFAFGLIGKAPPRMALGAPIEIWYVILLGFLLGILAQLGDLFESLLKRSVGVKDAGQLIPGHGGLLDRLDSIVVTGILVYYYLIWVL